MRQKDGADLSLLQALGKMPGGSLWRHAGFYLTLMLVYSNIRVRYYRSNVMQNITKLKAGERGVIAKLDGDPRFLSRITAIGLTPGCPVEILRSEKRQPVLLYSRDTIIALSRREGAKIMMEPSV
jgi:ferrous iron transport protein A